MKNYIKGILLSFLLLSCLTACKGIEVNTNSDSISSQTATQIPNTEHNEFDALWNMAASMETEFEINGIKAKVIKATRNLTFAGSVISKNLIGIRIYMDYSKSEWLASQDFKVIDKNMVVYNHVNDGLDFLGKNRVESGAEYGYIRVSVPYEYTEFLLRFNDNNGEYKYIKLNVIDE